MSPETEFWRIQGDKPVRIKPTAMDRRQFMRIAGIGLGAVALGVAGCGSSSPSAEHGPAPTLVLKAWETFAQKTRPKSYAHTYRVNPTGGDGAYTTIHAAMVQAQVDVAIDNGTHYSASNESFALGPGPWNRALILIDPGTYTEGIGSNTNESFIDFVGSSGNRDDVVIQGYGASRGAVVSGSNSYVAHVTVKLLDGPGNTDEVYVLNIGMAPCNTVIFEDCAFINTNSHSWVTVDIIVGDNCALLFVGCDFHAPGIQAIDLELNGPYRSGQPSHVTFYDCAVESGGKAGPVVFADLGYAGASDVVAWIGGSITPTSGTNQVYVQATPGGGSGYVSGDHFTVQEYLDPAAITHHVIDSGATGAHLVRLSDPVVPVAGISAGTAAYFLPSAIGTVRTVVPNYGYADTPTGHTLTANRVYYVPVHITETVRFAGVVAQVVSGSDGLLYAGLFGDSEGQPWKYLDPAFMPGPGATAVSGSVTIPANGGPQLLFPGEKVWVAIVCTDATARLLCSSTMTHVYYQDGFNPSTNLLTATPVALPANTPCPIPSLSCT